ncbi:hypothetical protein [Pedobacter steynii]|uniref:Uncharacterized protein n=1 Tax=Pedobacter steynii TaxID=430522 RepID=A0A1D7QAW9_9SPHI|nr:hypothetical protein [Pedobacter steynii]AOM75787.1 hypothetical protein BFS30_00530 [Pedobacter steynii]
MKTTSKTIRLAVAFCFLFILPLSVFSATPDIYVCGTGSVTLAYSGTYVLATGDKVVWQKVDAGGVPVSGYTAVVNTFSGTAGSADLTVTGGTDITAAGEHFWVAHVISADPAACTGDVSTPIDIYMLPTFTVAVTPAATTYCVAGTTNTTKTVVSSLATPASGLPANVVFTYDWNGTTPGAGTVDGTDSKKFNMTSVTPASYTVTSNVKYDVSATGKTLKSAGGTACLETGSTTITVAPKPGTPTITVS